MPRSAEAVALRPHGLADRGRAMEVSAVTGLVLIFIAIAADKVWSLRAAAERVAVEHFVSTLRTAIALRVIEGVARGDGPGAIAALWRSNPILLLDSVPTNYLGERSDTEPTGSASYSWYFDPNQGMLVYRVGSGSRLATALPGLPRIRWQVRVAFEDRDGNGRFDEATDRLHGVDLRPVEPYHWTAYAP